MLILCPFATPVGRVGWIECSCSISLNAEFEEAGGEDVVEVLNVGVGEIDEVEVVLGVVGLFGWYYVNWFWVERIACPIWVVNTVRRVFAAIPTIFISRRIQVVLV